MEITYAAIKKLTKVIEHVKKGACLRVLMTEGCCGPTVAMDLVDTPDKDDQEIIKKDFRFYVHKDAMPHLAKATVDCDKDGEIVITGLPEHDGGCCH